MIFTIAMNPVHERRGSQWHVVLYEPTGDKEIKVREKKRRLSKLKNLKYAFTKSNIVRMGILCQ